MLECRRYALSTLEGVLKYWRDILQDIRDEWHDWARREEWTRGNVIAVVAMLRQLNLLQAENARLLEEVAALKANRLGAFTDEELAGIYRAVWAKPAGATTRICGELDAELTIRQHRGAEEDA